MLHVRADDDAAVSPRYDIYRRALAVAPEIARGYTTTTATWMGPGERRRENFDATRIVYLALPHGYVYIHIGVYIRAEL